MRYRYGLLVLVIFLNCTYSVVGRVSARDYAMVQEGRYGGNVLVRNGDERLMAIAAGRRREIETDPVFLRRVAECYFSVPESTEFRFMYLGEDAARQQLVLRYFGFAPKPFIIAGWQVQFVFDRAGRRLIRVYAQEVPLE